jgi:toluene monooxygenase system ferredoxin subunit
MFARAMKLAELWDDDKVGIEVAGKKVLLVRLGGQVYAYEDRCCHQAQPLSPGRIEDGKIVCPVHEWQYDARTGEGVNPRNQHLKVFPVEIRDGDIFIEVD